MNVLLGTKKDMSRVFVEGKSIPVTIVNVKGTVKAKSLNGATYVGFGKKKAGKTLTGQFKELGYVPQHVETVSSDVDVDINSLEVNDIVSVSGITKGKGFQGVVKRFNFAGGPKTHGQSSYYRHGGSLGSGTTPGRVWKGKKMPGRMGTQNSTIKNIKVISVDKVNGLVALKGSLPGGRNTVLKIVKK